ncbi:hypothetical protein B0T11DRAFT_88177 [Plectosphaerella cucumerina]|uniref:Uncharacterized protein n=1 Tax=Plectosphaerella cucumerina TaxID=40658 RepID=A0A8K0TM11_9PEZI|nr:hypothetical protein B0T11DRAFT_88177 [Plectosphaerella cucumerina]
MPATAGALPLSSIFSLKERYISFLSILLACCGLSQLEGVFLYQTCFNQHRLLTQIRTSGRRTFIHGLERTHGWAVGRFPLFSERRAFPSLSRPSWCPFRVIGDG